MPTYVVTAREIHAFEQRVEAADREQAVVLAQANGEWGPPALVEYLAIEEDDVEEVKPVSAGAQDVASADPALRKFQVYVRQLKEFSLEVMACDEEDARDRAYAMPWPDGPQNITLQDVNVWEEEEESGEGEVVDDAA